MNLLSRWSQARTTNLPGLGFEIWRASVLRPWWLWRTKSVALNASLADVPNLVEDRRYRDQQVRRLKGLGRGDSEAQVGRAPSDEVGRASRNRTVVDLQIPDFRRSTKFMQAVSGRPSVSLDEILSRDTALLIRVPTTGLGVGPSKFLGSLIVERVLRHTLEKGFSQFDYPASLIVDEFQTFVGTSFVQLIPEARKFNLGLTLANQTLSQLSTFSLFEGGRSSVMEDAILGNAGNLIIQLRCVRRGTPRARGRYRCHEA